MEKDDLAPSFIRAKRRITGVAKVSTGVIPPPFWISFLFRNVKELRTKITKSIIDDSVAVK
jgi:hypothetical protein